MALEITEGDSIPTKIPEREIGSRGVPGGLVRSDGHDDLPDNPMRMDREDKRSKQDSCRSRCHQRRA